MNSISTTGNSQIELDGSPICRKLDYGEVKIISCMTAEQIEIWHASMTLYHPLGTTKGVRVKQLALIGNRVVGASGWKSPVLHLQCRDAFIGWNAEQRKRDLLHIANQARFLILPFVEMPYLASHLLSRFLKQLRGQWETQTGVSLYLAETFVDGRFQEGTSYHAANWILLGHTRGYERIKKDRFVYHGNRKQVWVNIVDRRFHFKLGVKEKYAPPNGALSKKQLEMLTHMIGKAKWHPKMEKNFNLNCLDEVSMKLKDYAESFRDCFARTNQMVLASTYWIGLMSDLKRKNIEAIALETGTQKPRTLQDFMCRYIWEDGKMMRLHRGHVGGKLNEEDGALALDPSEFPKKGRHSVGVAYMYCGNTGKVDNCQSGVFASYISSKGYSLVDKQLFLPEAWFSEEYKERYAAAKIPSALKYVKKTEIALQMLKDLKAEGQLQFKWVLGDAAFGACREFRDNIPKGLFYFLDVRKDMVVKLINPNSESLKEGRLRYEPKPRSIGELFDDENLSWNCMELGPGEKGPIVAKVAAFQVQLPETGEQVCLFLRQDPDGKRRASFCNVPENMPLLILAQISLLRWKIEQCFREAKDILGMGDYENRTWDGWHRHMTLVFTIHFFLTFFTEIFDPEQKGCISRYMAKQIIHAALTEGPRGQEHVLSKIFYHIQRNAKAMAAHWKTKIAKAKEWGNKIRLEPFIFTPLPTKQPL